jgi:molybdenum cofactor guanylyltransferase
MNESLAFSLEFPVAGVLLAGGQSRRMGGGDKCLRLLRGETILSRIIRRARPQVSALAINANGDPDRFAAYGLPVLADSIPGFAGPLAGILAGLDWAAGISDPCLRYMASFATDAPFLPLDLVARLAEPVREGRAVLACASSCGRVHPVFGLWPVALREDLRHAVSEQGIRKVGEWTEQFSVVAVEWPADRRDPFFNANRPDDLEEAERLAQIMG